MFAFVWRAALIAVFAVMAWGCTQPAAENPAPEAPPEANAPAPVTSNAGAWKGTIDDQELLVTIDQEGNLEWKEGGKTIKGRARFEGEIVYFLLDSGGGLSLDLADDTLTGELKPDETSAPRKVVLSRQ